jgi:hypothetical protein
LVSVLNTEFSAFFKSNKNKSLISELARDKFQSLGKYNVVSGIMSPVSNGYKKKVNQATEKCFKSQHFLYII